MGLGIEREIIRKVQAALPRLLWPSSAKVKQNRPTEPGTPSSTTAAMSLGMQCNIEAPIPDPAPPGSIDPKAPDEGPHFDRLRHDGS
jgi:hypothetical protein